MTRAFKKALCRLLILALAGGSFEHAYGAMIATESTVLPASTSLRQAALQALARSDVSSQLQRLGIDPSAAARRVDAMTDAELAALAGQIDAQPAGGYGGGGSGAVLIMLVIVGIAIWWAMRER